MEDMGSKKKITNSTRKPTTTTRSRRRSHTRKPPGQDGNSFINTAEARREIATALHLHRSSCSSSSSPFNSRWVPTIPSSNDNQPSMGTTSLPFPEPTWSITEPSVVATPSPPMEALEFEWTESLDSNSYNWWLGFLNTLDVKSGDVSSKCPFEEKIVVENSGSSRVFGDSVLALDENDESSSLDEWLIIPTSEEQGEML